MDKNQNLNNIFTKIEQTISFNKCVKSNQSEYNQSMMRMTLEEWNQIQNQLINITNEKIDLISQIEKVRNANRRISKVETKASLNSR
jgi:hypothetical protein